MIVASKIPYSMTTPPSSPSAACEVTGDLRQETCEAIISDSFRGAGGHLEHRCEDGEDCEHVLLLLVLDGLRCPPRLVRSPKRIPVESTMLLAEGRSHPHI